MKNQRAVCSRECLTFMGNITVLLGEMRTGNPQARSELFTQVYDELTRLARLRLPGGRQAHLDAPSLVHEAYLRLSEQEMPSLRDRREFFAYSATVMRNVVVDIARRHNAQKRGSGMAHLTLSNVEAQAGVPPWTWRPCTKRSSGWNSSTTAPSGWSRCVISPACRSKRSPRSCNCRP